jgi:hypothetical protein
MTDKTIRQLDDECRFARRNFDALSLNVSRIKQDLCIAEDAMVKAEDHMLMCELAWETAVEREAEARAAAEDADARWKDDARDDVGYLQRKEAQEMK